MEKFINPSNLSTRNIFYKFFSYLYIYIYIYICVRLYMSLNNDEIFSML